MISCCQTYSALITKTPIAAAGGESDLVATLVAADLWLVLLLPLLSLLLRAQKKIQMGINMHMRQGTAAPAMLPKTV